MRRIKKNLIISIAYLLAISSPSSQSFAGDGPQISSSHEQDVLVQTSSAEAQAQSASRKVAVVKPAATSTAKKHLSINRKPPAVKAATAVDVQTATTPSSHPATLKNNAQNDVMDEGGGNIRYEQIEQTDIPGVKLPTLEIRKSTQSSGMDVNPFADQFFVPANQKTANRVELVRGFPIIKTPNKSKNTEYSIVTDFKSNILKSRYLPGLKNIKEIDSYIKSNAQVAQYAGTEIRQLPVPTVQGGVTTLYFVGEKAFTDATSAAQAVDFVKLAVESYGGNFAEVVKSAPVYVPEPEPVLEIKTPAQFKREEELMLKFTDQLGIGEKMYGVLYGENSGTPITWQSFGETSWRMTNLSARHYDTQVGYWANRIVFGGIRFPLNNLSPFVESIVSMDSSDTSWTNNLRLYVGMEWRPLARNPWLVNFRPYGGIPILEWMRNYRFYIKYGEQYNIKNEILGAQHYDLIWGVQCFYEWGTDLSPLDEGKPETFADYIRQYVWGEYFGDYYVSKTGFANKAEKPSYNAITANSSLILGIKLPGIPLPENPINNELVFMPYMRFEHVNNSDYSDYYQNQYFIAAGVRIMPFRAYKWKENEWLSKIAIFGEWVGVGRAQRNKQDPDTPPYIPDYDLRFGVKFSSRRF